MFFMPIKQLEFEFEFERERERERVRVRVRESWLLNIGRDGMGRVERERERW
jgi:hypothetical protein